MLPVRPAEQTVPGDRRSDRVAPRGNVCGARARTCARWFDHARAHASRERSASRRDALGWSVARDRTVLVVALACGLALAWWAMPSDVPAPAPPPVLHRRRPPRAPLTFEL